MDGHFGAKPRARRGDLIVERLQDEVLVYDLRRHRAHALNPTAALIWEGCDGVRDMEGLRALVEAEVGEPVGPDFVALALERLGRSQLLEGDEGGPSGAGRGGEEPGHPGHRPESRRAALRRMARVGVALPVVLTIVSPTPALAATRITPGDCFRQFSQNEGKCCTNGRKCIQWFQNRGICLGAQC